MNNDLKLLCNEAEDYFSIALTKRHLDIDGTVSAYCSNVNDSPLNTLVIRVLKQLLIKILERTKNFFALTDTPWCVVLRENLVNQNNSNILKDFGFMPNQ